MSRQDQLNELGHFLRDRRARLLPAEAGLPPTARRRVRGLRREEVAMLAGIGVSWYTSLENGGASGVSEATLLAIAGVLRLTESERHYITALAGEAEEPGSDAVPAPLVIDTLAAIAFPAYVIDASWSVLAWNAAFRRVWQIGANEAPFNAIERLFMHPVARQQHGDAFIANITPVIAMLRSGLGRRPSLHVLAALRDRLLADDAIRTIWNDYAIVSPFTPTSCTIETPLGPFRYRTLDLHIPGAAHGLVVQVPDEECRRALNFD